MKIALSFLLICITATYAIAQGSYEERMETALNLHIEAKTFSEEKKSEEAYLKIAESDNDWLAYYWAAYINTQLFNALGNPQSKPPKDANPKTILDKAQSLLNNASDLVDSDNKKYLSDIGALQILIHQFNLRLNPTETEKKLLLDKMDEELKRAAINNRENPLLYVLIGTNMVGAGDKFSQIISGRALLYEADRLFKLRKKKRSLSTHFNEEWLTLFWLDFSNQQLEQKANS